MLCQAQNQAADVGANEELVDFNPVSPLNLAQGELTVSYNLGSRVTATPLDWIGIFQSNSSDYSKPLASMRAPPEPTCKAKPQERHLTFPAKLIQPLAHKTATYHCLYITEDHRVLGSTQSFNVNEDTDDMDVKSELSQFGKSHDSQSANQDVVSYFTVSSELLSSDDEWEFASHSAIQRSNSLTSDISDIVILSTSPSKEAVKMETRLLEDAKLRPDIEDVISEDPKFTLDSKPQISSNLQLDRKSETSPNMTDQDKRSHKLAAHSREALSLGATRSSNKVYNKGFQDCPILKQPTDSKQYHKSAQKEATSPTKSGKLSKKKQQTGQDRKHYNQTNSLDEESTRTAKKSTNKVNENRVNLFELSQNKSTDRHQLQILATSESDVCIPPPHNVRKKKLKHKNSTTIKEPEEDVPCTPCARYAKTRPNEIIENYNDAKLIQKPKSPEADWEDHDWDGAATKRKSVKKFRKKAAEKLKKTSTAACEDKTSKCEQNQEESMLVTKCEILKVSNLPDDLKIVCQCKAIEGGDNSHAKVSDSFARDLEMVSTTVEKCKKVQRKCRKVREKCSRKEGKKNKIASAWMADSMLERCFDDVDVEELNADSEIDQPESAERPVISCQSSQGPTVLSTRTEPGDSAIAGETETTEEKVFREEESGRKTENDVESKGKFCLSGEWSTAVQNLMNVQPLISRAFTDRREKRQRATTTRSTVKSQATFKSKYKFKFSRRDEVQRARTLKKWLILNRARVGHLQQHLFMGGDDKPFCLVELPKPNLNLAAILESSNEIMKSKSLLPLKTPSLTSLMFTTPWLTDSDTRPDILPQKLNPKVIQAQPTFCGAPILTQGNCVWPVSAESAARNERPSYASVVKQSMNEHRQQTLPAKTHQKLDSCIIKIHSSEDSVLQQEDLEQRGATHRQLEESKATLGQSQKELGSAGSIEREQPVSVCGNQEGKFGNNTDTEFEQGANVEFGQNCGHEFNNKTGKKHENLHKRLVHDLKQFEEPNRVSLMVEQNSCWESEWSQRDGGLSGRTGMPMEHSDSEICLSDGRIVSQSCGQVVDQDVSLNWPLPDIISSSSLLEPSSCCFQADRDSELNSSNESSSKEVIGLVEIHPDPSNATRPASFTNNDNSLNIDEERPSDVSRKIRSQTSDVSLALALSREENRDLKKRMNILEAQLETLHPDLNPKKHKMPDTDTRPRKVSPTGCQDKGKFKDVKHVRFPVARSQGSARVLARSSTETLRLKSKVKGDETQSVLETNMKADQLMKQMSKPLQVKVKCHKLKLKISDHQIKLETGRASDGCMKVSLTGSRAEGINSDTVLVDTDTETCVDEESATGENSDFYETRIPKEKLPVKPVHNERGESFKISRPDKFMRQSLVNEVTDESGQTAKQITDVACSDSRILSSVLMNSVDQKCLELKPKIITLECPRAVPFVAPNILCDVSSTLQLMKPSATTHESRLASDNVASHQQDIMCPNITCCCNIHQPYSRESLSSSSLGSLVDISPKNASRLAHLEGTCQCSTNSNSESAHHQRAEPPPGIEQGDSSSQQNRCRNLIRTFMNPFFTSGSSSHVGSTSVQPFMWKSTERLQCGNASSPSCHEANEHQSFVNNKCVGSVGSVKARQDISLRSDVVESSVDEGNSQIGFSLGKPEYILFEEIANNSVSNVSGDWSSLSTDVDAMPTSGHMCLSKSSHCKNCLLRQHVEAEHENHHHFNTNPDCPIHGHLVQDLSNSHDPHRHSNHVQHFNQSNISWLPTEHWNCAATPYSHRANTHSVYSNPFYLFHSEYTPASTPWLHDTSPFQQTTYPYNNEQTTYPYNNQQTPCSNVVTSKRKQCTRPNGLMDNIATMHELRSLPKQHNDSSTDGSQFCYCTACKRQIEAMSHCHQTSYH